MTTKAELLKLVRLNCSECLGGHRAHLNLSVNNPSEIEGCTGRECVYFDFRFGKDPYPNKNKSRASQERYLSGATGLKRKSENQGTGEGIINGSETG